MVSALDTVAVIQLLKQKFLVTLFTPQSIPLRLQNPQDSPSHPVVLLSALLKCCEGLY